MTPVARRHIKVEAANTMNWLWLAFHRVRIVLVSVSRGLLLASRQITLVVEYGIESAAS
jgi:hypothetical protein